MSNCTNIYRKKTLVRLNKFLLEMFICTNFQLQLKLQKKIVRLNKYFKYNSRSIALMIVCTNYSWQENKSLVQLNTVWLDLCSFSLMFNRNTNLFPMSRHSCKCTLVQSDISANYIALKLF